MRKTVDVKISDDRIVKDGKPVGELSRDAGKTFRLTEMPARQAEKWAMKALFAISRSGLNLPENFGEMAQGGMQALAYFGIQALLSVSFEDAEPLLDEMLSCVQIVEPKIVRILTADDIDEVKTLILLRKKVLELHVGFSLADAG